MEMEMTKTKIIIHFGFPKTGSSSLQFGFFLPLHNSGSVNLKTWRMYSKTEPLEQRPSSRLFNGKEVLADYLEFREGVLNIFSDESLTAPMRLRENNFGEIDNPFNFPEVLKNAIDQRFGSDIEIIPLILIRNQSQLIYSQYVEEYNLKKYKNIDIVFDESGKVNMRGYDIYKFASYIEKLESVFGEGSINVFMFEKWQQSPKECLEFFQTHVNLDYSRLESLLKEANFNSKKKNAYGYYTKDSQDFIPLFSEQVNKSIMSYFYDDNEKLTSYLSRFDLANYGYLKSHAG